MRSAMKIALQSLSLLNLISVLCAGFQFPQTPQGHSKTDNRATQSRQGFIFSVISVPFLSINSFPSSANAKSYSANARNLERMNAGDMSGGSSYDNNPSSEAGKRRRAITGCKNSVARAEAAENILKFGALSEKECNQMVLEGKSEFMLQALRTLDCPTCPYGISGTRD